MTVVETLLLEEAKTYARIIAKQLLPMSVTDRLRVTSQSQRRRQRWASSGSQGISRKSLVSDLRALGMREGRDVLIHSSLSAIGPLEDGAATIFSAIAEVAGPDATLLAPAYPMSGTMYEWMSTPEPFDVARTSSRMGALTEFMRRLPGARRSAHPTHSVVAVGPNADDYTSEHHAGPTPTGARSPFYKHILDKGQIICLGTGIGKITSYHVVEDLMPGFPVDVYLKKPMSKIVVFHDGQRCTVETRVNDPALSPWRVDNFKPKEREFYQRMRDHQLVREGRVGMAQSHVVDADKLFVAMQEWSTRGITIYHNSMLTSVPRLMALAFGKSH
jgi:aminoglycoside 3-N-acetyltransferase